jgi:hypothetical protein
VTILLAIATVFVVAMILPLLALCAVVLVAGPRHRVKGRRRPYRAEA